MRTAAVIAAALVAGCEPSGPTDVVGPYTGELHRFVVDQLEVPINNEAARALGADVDGDGVIDNQAGMVIATLRGQNDGDVHIADKIASGVLASVVLIQADDLVDDDTVAVSYLGFDNAPVEVAGGQFVDGVFQSNRLATTRVPATAVLRVPAIADVDPLEIFAAAVQIDLTPDGGGGYDALIGCGLRLTDIVEPAIDGLQRMAQFNPQGHLDFARLIDADHDGVLSHDEIADNSLFKSLMTPDLHLFDGADYAPRHPGDADAMSLGFRVHLAPCPAGNCALDTPQLTCFDRVLDGDETDVDCGGSCQRCPGAARCAAPTDCQTATCQSDNTCAAPTCSDGIRDGFEGGVDCGLGCALACP